VAFPGPKYPFKVTQIPQGLVPVLVDDNSFNFLLLLDRKTHDHIRHIDLPIHFREHNVRSRRPGVNREPLAYLEKSAIIKGVGGDCWIFRFFAGPPGPESAGFGVGLRVTKFDY
jgi:hypothetical protein